MTTRIHNSTVSGYRHRLLENTCQTVSQAVMDSWKYHHYIVAQIKVMIHQCLRPGLPPLKKVPQPWLEFLLLRGIQGWQSNWRRPTSSRDPGCSLSYSGRLGVNAKRMTQCGGLYKRKQEKTACKPINSKASLMLNNPRTGLETGLPKLRRKADTFPAVLQ